MKYIIETLMLVLPYVILMSTNVIAGDMIKIGVATVDITPEEKIWLAGYGSRNKPSEGIIHPLHAKAIAFEDESGSKAIIVTTDLIGLHRGLAEEIASRVRNELGIPRARLMLTSSHTHTGPILYASNLRMFDLSEEEWKTIADYTDFLKRALFEVIQNSILYLSQCSLSFGKE